MNKLFSILGILLLGQISEAQVQATNTDLFRVISTDERVIVYGRNSTTCSAVLSQITSLRNELNTILQDVDEASGIKHFPLNNNLIVTLSGEVNQAPPKNNYLIQPRKVEGSDRYRIDLKIHLAKGLNRLELRKNALECLLMDRCLNDSLREEQPIQVAPWILAGVQERMAWRKGEADRGLYKALFKNKLLMDIEEMVTLQDPEKLDAAQRTSFRISAGAFLISMLNQEGGKSTFLDYLAEAPSHEGEPLLLFRTTFFSGGLSDQGLAKWWALQLADLTQEFVTETLSPLATEQALTEILKGTLENDQREIRSYRLIAYEDILALSKKERGLLLSPMLERIGLLSFRCFPSYRSLLSGYARITEQLAEGDKQDVAELLIELEEKRTIFKKVGERTRDYLDWYQIVNATELTGEFADYQRLKRELETKNPSHPGPIGRYLNSVQSLYEQ